MRVLFLIAAIMTLTACSGSVSTNDDLGTTDQGIIDVGTTDRGPVDQIFGDAEPKDADSDAGFDDATADMGPADTGNDDAAIADDGGPADVDIVDQGTTDAMPVDGGPQPAATQGFASCLSGSLPIELVVDAEGRPATAWGGRLVASGRAGRYAVASADLLLHPFVMT